MSDENEIKETAPAGDENETNAATPASDENEIKAAEPVKRSNSIKEKIALSAANAVSALKAHKKIAISLLALAVLSGGAFIFKDKIWKPELQLINQPVFSPDPGDYKSGQTVTISCEVDGAEIKYTLDASDPDESSLVYSAPIIVNNKTTIKAIAVKEEMATSEIAVAEYKVQKTLPKNNGPDASKDLPKLINNYGDARKKSEYDSIISIGLDLMIKNPAKAVEYETDIAWAYAEKNNLPEAEKRFELLIDKLKGGDEKVFKALLEKIINYRNNFGLKLYQKISDESKNRKYNEIAAKAEDKKMALTTARAAAAVVPRADEKSPVAANDKTKSAEKSQAAATDKTSVSQNPPLAAADKAKAAEKTPAETPDKTKTADKQAPAAVDKARLNEKSPAASVDKTKAVEKPPAAIAEKAGIAEKIPIAANEKTKAADKLPVTAAARAKAVETLPVAPSDKPAAAENQPEPADKAPTQENTEKINSNADRTSKTVENYTELPATTDNANDNIADPVFTGYILEPINGMEILRPRIREMEISGKMIKPVGGKRNTDYEKASESFNNANFEEAMRLYCGALKYRRKIYDHLKTGRPLKSISVMGSIDPGDVKIINDIGCVYAVYGSDDWAIAFLEWARSLNPNYTLAYKNLFNLYIYNGIFDRAKDLMKDLSRVYPRGLEIELMLADMNYKLAKAGRK